MVFSEGGQIGACSRAVFQPRAVLYCPLRPQSSSFQGAQGLTTGTELIAFHSSHLLLCFRYSARGITVWHCARTRSLWEPVLLSSVASTEFDCAFSWIRLQFFLEIQYQEGTAGKAVRYREGTARTSGETNFSGVHRDICAARSLGARVLVSTSRTVLRISCRAGPSRASSRDSPAQK